MNPEGMAFEYPAWAGSGPVVVEYDGKADNAKCAQRCASREEAIRVLRANGYEVTQ